MNELQSIKQYVSDLFRLKLQEYINVFLCFNSLITSGSTVISTGYVGFIIIIIIIGIQPLGQSGQRPELSQATGMSLVRCILGRFLGVVCHCFPPRLEVPTFATRCPHVRYGGRWNLWARNVR